MLDFNHVKPSGAFAIPDLEIGARAIGAARVPREYLGGSRLGETCARKLQYEYLGTPSERPHTSKMAMIFATGHALEAEVITLLRASGYDVRSHKPDGHQYGYSVAGGRMRGSVDAVVIDGPKENGPYPYLGEGKAVGAKYWAAIVRRGVAAERPVYAAQIAIYQAYMQLTDHPALFWCVNRDSGEVHFERVPFNAKLAQETSDRGVQVLQACDAGEQLPRGYGDPEAFGCRWCDYRERCWKLA